MGRVVLLVLVALTPAAAQGALGEVELALESGDQAGAGDRVLARLDELETPRARYGWLLEVHALCEEHGRPEALLAWLERPGAQGDAVARHIRGWMLMELKLLDRARENLQASVRLDPDNLSPREDLARLAHRAFRFREAARRWKDLVRERLPQGAGSGPEQVVGGWQEQGAWNQRLADSLQAGRTRQLLVLGGSVLLLGGLLLGVGRRLRRVEGQKERGPLS